MNLQHSFSVAQNATTHSENTHKHYDFGKILNVALELERLGYSEAYLKTMINALKSIASRTDLDSPSSVLTYIARAKLKDSYKANLCDFYGHYCKFYGISYSKPKYSREHRIPKVPSEEKINLIIGHASKKYAIIYKLVMECGLRPVEIGNLTLDCIDLEKGAISVCSAKNGNPRILKLKSETQAMLTEYVKERNFSLDDKIFPKGSTISNTYERLRTAIAKKLHDSELRKIRLYDFRHYYATMLYYRTKDILLVKKKLGHKNINNTLIYTHLVCFNDKEEYYSATAKTVDETRKLIESGFEYVTELDGIKLFRKRK